MNKKFLVTYLVSFLAFLSILYASEPGLPRGERPCRCTNHDTDEYCKQWCGKTDLGLCMGELLRWGCWCRGPGTSWICDCGYVVVCEDFWSKYFSASCDDTYCGRL